MHFRRLSIFQVTGKKKTAIKKTTEKKDGRSRATVADEITDYK